MKSGPAVLKSKWSVHLQGLKERWSKHGQQGCPEWRQMWVEWKDWRVRGSKGRAAHRGRDRHEKSTWTWPYIWCTSEHSNAKIQYYSLNTGAEQKGTFIGKVKKKNVATRELQHFLKDIFSLLWHLHWGKVGEGGEREKKRERERMSERERASKRERMNEYG